MSDEVLAKRYAQALVEVAEESGGVSAVEAIQSELERFIGLMDADHRRLGEALESPIFTVDERRGVLELVLPRLGLGATTRNLLLLVNEKRRFPQLRAIAEAYRDQVDTRANRARVKVETAQPLTPELAEEIRAALARVTGKQVILTTEVKPELISGLVARIGDTVYDSSLRTRIEQLKQALLNSPVAVA